MWVWLRAVFLSVCIVLCYYAYSAPRSVTGSKREVIQITSHSSSLRRQILSV